MLEARKISVNYDEREAVADVSLCAEAGKLIAIIGPKPIDTVGNCQKSGISHGCGYDDKPMPGPTTSRRK